MKPKPQEQEETQNQTQQQSKPQQPFRPNREILRLSLPAIVSNITVPLTGIFDTAIAGHLGADSFIGSIAVGAMMLNVTFWLFGFLRMGTTGLTAQAFGENDDLRLRRIFTRTFLLGALIGLALLLLSEPLSRMLLATVAPDAAVAQSARQYYLICLCAAPAMLSTTAIQGWLFGMQTTLLPMIVSISVNILNIALSLTLVYIFRLGFVGIALGTLGANWCGLLIALLLARTKRRGNLFCTLRQLRGRGEIKRLFRVNGDIFFRSGCIMAVSLSVTAIGARLGELTLATNALMMQFFHFFSFFMDGLAFTAEALTGRFAGARNFKDLRRSRRALLLWSGAIAAIFIAIYTLFPEAITSLMTDSPRVGANMVRYHLWLTLIPPLTVAAFIYDGFYIGLTATRRMLLATAMAAALFFLICFLHAADGSLRLQLPDNNRLWTAFLSYLFLRGALLALWSRRVFSPRFINSLTTST